MVVAPLAPKCGPRSLPPGLRGPLSRSQVRAPRPGTIPEVRQHLHGVTAEDGAAILAQQ
jgi:hypothetical protein